MIILEDLDSIISKKPYICIEAIYDSSYSIRMHTPILLTNQDIPAVRANIAAEKEMNLFIEGDIEQYGLKQRLFPSGLLVRIGIACCSGTTPISSSPAIRTSLMYKPWPISYKTRRSNASVQRKLFSNNWLPTTLTSPPFKAHICVVWNESISRKSELERNKYSNLIRATVKILWTSTN